ncbi:MAG: hypothetical protein A2626_02070 [Candidatus Nealsonbacteria bacterium RIFCSPHIGHO2_01_FULL_38_55]|uniref:Uncharacterized protein n=1 Tax=Candidatus Nealsonbacteria bacterium RIFCSPHIGHO2_01_FULL_38_55 TaxID=1801664 RepID=A0A1G2E1U7_9BACT|nr:MAG: hypothetical protein A2626_02070 [Candidatus Nealsonbacteria bacterium RIFCSPHIGHO2_01_FULL_38_55]
MLSWSFFQTSERKFATIMRRMQSIRRIIIFNIIPRSVGVSENVFSFTPPSLRNYSKFAAEIWRKDQEILFLFGISQFNRIWIDSELGAISKNWN